jgi:hypothetical protein
MGVWGTVTNKRKLTPKTSVLYQNDGYKLFTMYNFVQCLTDYCGPYNEFVKQGAVIICFNI